MKKRPAAVIPLPGADVGAETRLGLGVDLVEEMVEQDVFGGDRRVGLQLEQPVAVVMLEAPERGGCLVDHRLDAGQGREAFGIVRRLSGGGLASPV